MDELEYMQIPEPSTSVTDIVNLISAMAAGDLPVGGDDEDKLHDILSMAVNIVHMNMTMETIETTNTYNDLIVGVNRSMIKKV